MLIMGLFIVIFLICLLIVFAISHNVNKNTKEDYETKKNVDNTRKNYMKKYDLYKREAFVLDIIDFDNYTTFNGEQKTFWGFREDDNLCLVSKDYNNDIGKIKININDIQRFNRLGDIDSYTEISGGNGGGSSIGKAVVGGIMAGGVGAVVASRNKINEIKTERIVNDDRITVLQVEKENENYYIKLTSQSYNGLIQLIPEKEISFVKDKQII
jgi:ABC-type transport system involved in multi-copper enzyme maturation permease subunit